MCWAGEGEGVDVGRAAVGPFLDVVDFDEVAVTFPRDRGGISYKE